ncbi:MAG TPA: hypothetical protein VMH36_18910 [Alphaproteobacteria bacterium]|nr:hypothetical protein [Alphaproteobacteria bacterium]
MLTAKDFLRAGTYMLKRYGEEAAERAANRASELRAAGETGLCQIWDTLFATVCELERSQAPVATPIKIAS